MLDSFTDKKIKTGNRFQDMQAGILPVRSMLIKPAISSHIKMAWSSAAGAQATARDPRRLREDLYYPPLEITTSLRHIITQQVYQLARVIKGECGQYQAFTPK